MQTEQNEKLSTALLRFCFGFGVIVFSILGIVKFGNEHFSSPMPLFLAWFLFCASVDISKKWLHPEVHNVLDKFSWGISLFFVAYSII